MVRLAAKKMRMEMGRSKELLVLIFYSFENLSSFMDIFFFIFFSTVVCYRILNIYINIPICDIQ